MALAYVIEFPSNQLTANQAIIDQYIAPQSTCSGACIVVQWSKIETSQNHLTWTAIDARLQKWQNIGKKCTLIVWGMDYSKPNGSTPSWVTGATGYQYVNCPSYGNVPVPYAGAYQTNYQSFVQKVMTKYGTNPNVARIRFGWGMGGETFPGCYYQLLALAGNAAAFDTTWENYIQAGANYADTFPQSAILDIAMNQYGSPLRLQVCDYIASLAVQIGWGFGTQGLQQSDITNYNNGLPTTSDWVAMFAKYPIQLTHLQTVKQTDPSNATGGVGSLDTLAPFALAHGCHIFELYLQDWQIAYDPTYQCYGTYGSVYQNAFQTIANG